MALHEYPLASPLPTTAPHPRDVGRKLLAPRQSFVDTCAFAGGEFANSITCGVGGICAQITAVNVLGCCPLLDFPNCGTGQTSCVNSVAMAVSCTGDCLFNNAVVKCTEGFNTICAVTRYHFSTIGSYLTGFGCGSVSEFITAYDYYTSNGQPITAVTPLSTAVINPISSTPTSLPPSSTPMTSTPVTSTPANSTPVVSTPLNPTHPAVSTTGNPPPNPIPGGAIAGIVIGAVAAIAIIAGLLAFICIRERHRRRENQPDPANLHSNPSPMMQTPASPPPVSHHMSMASMPSATSSTPLTQANIAAMSPRSEVLPSESASQINVPGSGLSQGSPPIYHSGAGSNTASQEHSGLGTLRLRPQYPTGPDAFPHANAPSVMSPGSAFGSMPPVHAPSVSPHGP